MNRQQLYDGIFDEVMTSVDDMNIIIAENTTDSIMRMIDKYSCSYANTVIGKDKSIPILGTIPINQHYEMVFGNIRAAEQRKRNKLPNN